MDIDVTYLQENSTYVANHRLMYENYFGPLRKGEEVHHIDAIVSNNDPENLIALPKKFHRWIHGRGPWNKIFYRDLARQGLITKIDLENILKMFNDGKINYKYDFKTIFINYLLDPLLSNIDTRIKDTGNYIFEDDTAVHRKVMEEHGHIFQPGEEVHHINRIRNDNSIENLIVLPRHFHSWIHKSSMWTPLVSSFVTKETVKSIYEEYKKDKRIIKNKSFFIKSIEKLRNNIF